MTEAVTHFIDEKSNRDDAASAMWTNQIQTFSHDDVMKFLVQLEDMWKINDRDDIYLSYRIGYENFFTKDELTEDGLPVSIDITRVESKVKRMNERLCELYHRSDTLNMMDIEDDNDMKISVRINRLLDQVDDAWQIVFRHARISERMNNPTYVPINPETDPSIFRMSTINNIEELNPFQQAVLQTLKDLYQRQIRRYKGQCCLQIKTLDGALTRAWKPIETIEEYVYGVAKKEVQYDLWKNLTARAPGHNDLIRHLKNTKDMQFPEIKKNRHVWSFKNGIFIGKEFDCEKSDILTPHWRASFYTYESNEFKNLDQTIVSSKYFDQEFPDYSETDWRDIPTPYFDSVLNYQKFNKDVCEWIFAMGGRLCFDVNEIDKWQCIPFLKGVARSGKSTLITKVFRKFYCTEDVKTLSNNVERKFGLSAIMDGFMFIAPEIKGDLALEQAEFQSIVSGEDVSIAVKHEKAKSFEWTVPGILGGNEVPNWRDNSGSILRRVLTADFTKQVREADPTLDAKLEVELPSILQKCVRAYLEFAQKWPEKDIWNIVPQYFVDVQRQLATSCSPLESFLSEPCIEFSRDKKCPLKFFKKKYSEFHGVMNKSLNQDIWAGPFGSRDIRVMRIGEPTKYQSCDDTFPVMEQNGTEFILGLDIVDMSAKPVMSFGTD
tara:strand:- start:10621 stop:12609 length:1989 start_codon:yes stop_codon:yes gene_type:complete